MQFTSRNIGLLESVRRNAGFLQTRLTSYESLCIRNSKSIRIATASWMRLRTICPVVADVSAVLGSPLGLFASALGGLLRLRHALEPYNDFPA